MLWILKVINEFFLTIFLFQIIWFVKKVNKIQFKFILHIFNKLNHLVYRWSIHFILY
jgi:hypothetical protein